MVEIQELLVTAKALADPTRLKLLRLLMERECAVHELVGILLCGQSRVSQHLAKLKAAGLATERREGRQVYYRANPAALLGLDQALLSFLYTSMDQVPDMRAEWQRWRDFVAASAHESHSGFAVYSGIPVHFRPQPVARTPRNEQAPAMRRHRILYLCTANSFRSQMAEGWTRRLGGSTVEVQSAGLEPTRIHPTAEAVMGEVGVDMAGQYAKGITPEMLSEADVIVTLCGAALGWFPAVGQDVIRQHWPFPDPAALAGSEETVLQASRQVREGIRRRVEALLTTLGQAS